MNLIKALLPASAVSVTLLAGVPGARAADLPARQAAPVEYVRICDAYGAGFFLIPGTDSCLKVGGADRAARVRSFLQHFRHQLLCQWHAA